MSSSRLVASTWTSFTLLVLASAPCRAQLDGAALLEQDVVGYADATVDGSIFEYRLPTWGYWSNQVDGSFGGEGSRFSTNANESDGDQLEFELGGRSVFRHESDEQLVRLQFRLDAGHDRSTTETRVGTSPSEKRIRREYLAEAAVIMRWDRYFAPQVAWILGGEAQAEYRESMLEDPGSTDTDVRRAASLAIEAGIAVGRVRDVTPVLRAERVAERFVALGRPRPSRAQVLALADQIAQREGYVAVYERHEKFFWPAVLAELAVESGFTPFEILYLIEVLEEPLAVRSQGQVIELTVARSRRTSDTSSDFTGTTLRAVAHWSHNLTLTHQLSAAATVSHFEADASVGLGPERSAIDEVWGVSAAHLWEIADRLVVRTELEFEHLTEEVVDTRETDGDRFSLELTADYFVEDHLSLRPWVSWRSTRDEQTIAEGPSTNWDTDSWRFGLSITYLRDRLVPGLGS